MGFAAAKSHKTGVSGKSATGKKTDPGKSRPSQARSAAGQSVARTEMTFRTHMSTRSLVVGASVMRELMRSVSPISEPGVKVKRRRKASPTRDPSETVRSPSPRTKRKEKKQKKKEKKMRKEKALKGGPVFSQTIKKIREGRERWSPASPSHYAPGSPTPHRARTAEPSQVPTDKAEGEISAPPTT